MGIFDIFKRKRTSINKETNSIIDDSSIEETQSVPLTIFYHEDDYKQVDILPKENKAFVEAESQAIEDFGEKHFDGNAYTDIYIRSDDHKVKLNSRNIKPSELESKLEMLGLKRNSNVLTGYGQSYRELHKDCIAYGQDYSAIYYDFADQVVQNIWLVSHWRIDRAKLSNCLYEIGKQWGLILQDWNLSETIDLTDKQAIDKYLSYYDD